MWIPRGPELLKLFAIELNVLDHKLVTYLTISYITRVSHVATQVNELLESKCIKFQLYFHFLV